ncbi:MAG: FHA domain-containing protein [Deltaproteobacteria bacterium]|nr:FHA domain-containing protein [Deltaproteobacteria bacterium]
MSLVLEERKTQRKEMLTGPKVTVGREDGCDLVINDSSVSRRHCTFYEEEGGWTLEDNGSRNGTAVEGVALQPGARAKVAPGAKLRIGLLDWVVSDAAAEATRTAVRVDPKKPSLRTTAFAIEDLIQKNAEASGRPIEGTLGQVLFKAQQALYPGQPIETLLEALLRLVLEYVPAGRASVQLYNPEADDVEPSLTLDQHGTEILAVKDFLMSKGVREKVLSERQCVLISDLKNDAEFKGRASLVGAGITSAIAAPIFDGGDVLGILYVDIRDGLHELFEDEATIVSLLASFGGTMLNAANMVTALMQSEAALREENLALKERLAVLEGDDPPTRIG